MGVSRLVAMKLLKSRWSENEEIVKRIRDEARLLALLRHHNIINVFDMTSIQGRTAVVMEYLEAIDLGQIISQMKEMKRRVPLKVCLEMVASVASALDAAYNQPPFPGEKPLRVIHRDIKPSNIMLDADGVVKVLDFGVAHSNFDGRESETRELQFGSIGYMAPERLFSEPESSASDVYSLGSTLFEAISSIPFGKALPTKEKHKEFVHKRINQLLGVLKLQDNLKKSLFDLLSEALAFEALERISANDLADRSRALARALKGPDLEMWAQKAVVHLRNAFAEPVDGSLNGEVITEDSAAFNLNKSMVRQNSNEEKPVDKSARLSEQVRDDMNSIDQGKVNQASGRLDNDDESTLRSKGSSGTGIYQSLSKSASSLDSEALAEAAPLINESSHLPVIDPSPSEILPMSTFSPDSSSRPPVQAEPPPPSPTPPPPPPPPIVPLPPEVNRIPSPPDIEDDTGEITHYDTSVPGLSSGNDISVSEDPSLSLSEPDMEIRAKPMTIPAAVPVSRGQSKFGAKHWIIIIVGIAIAYAVYTGEGGDGESGKTKVQTETGSETTGDDPVKPVKSDVERKEASAPKVDLYEAEPGEATITIFSEVEDIKWIRLNCGEGMFKGVDKVISPLKNSKECSINAKFKSAGTNTVSVPRPKAGAYHCFFKRKDTIVAKCKYQK